jgi:hypothetical protein
MVDKISEYIGGWSGGLGRLVVGLDGGIVNAEESESSSMAWRVSGICVSELCRRRRLIQKKSRTARTTSAPAPTQPPVIARRFD